MYQDEALLCTSCGIKYWGMVWQSVTRCALCGRDLKATRWSGPSSWWTDERRAALDRLKNSLTGGDGAGE